MRAMPESKITCKLCKSNEVSKTGEICADCGRTLGIVPLPLPRRPPAPCSRCQGTRFVRVVPREYTATGIDYVNERVAPMTLTGEPDVSGRLFFSGSLERSTPSAPRAGAAVSSPAGCPCRRPIA
jgi:hypothetical protein